MDYKKRYEEALERAKRMFSEKELNYIFPELEDSEDELTWLTKYIEEEAYNLSIDIRDDEDRIKLKKLQKALAWLEKQGEQFKTDKDRLPKFKVGDWVVTDKYGTIQIGAVNSFYYTLKNGMDFSTSYAEKYWRLWTIEDAKEGDVLNANGAPFIYKIHDKTYVYFYCGLNLAGEFIIDTWDNNDIWDNNSRVYPATKEQRDLLFKRMKEAGYEWNAEKKELNNIENQGEQIHSNSEKVIIDEEPKWTEEDEETMLHCCGAVASTDSYKREDKEKFLDWLTSLKERMDEKQ